MPEARRADLEERLAAHPRIELAHLPTPLERLGRLSAELGGRDVWVKRDDATGLALGGNKVRKLEYLLGQARAENADGVITVGGVQSNHARQTAAAAARLGFECHLVLPRVVPREGVEYEQGGNVLLDHLFGAHVHVVRDEAEAAGTIASILQDAESRGRRFVVHPAGGSTAVGCLGYVRALGELCDQLGDTAPQFSRVYLAIGSGGTLAGLLCGAAATRFAPEIRGVSVLKAPANHIDELAKLAADTADLLDLSAPEQRPEVQLANIEARQLGEGYGIPTEAGLEALRLTAQLEGLLLDPVYTSKAMAALIADLRSDDLPGDGPVLFWHTGGAPGLFGYREELSAAVS